MDIREFWYLSAGKWFSLRSNYYLDKGKAENSQADIAIDILAPDSPQVLQLCQQNNIDPNLSLGGALHSWDNSVDWGKPKQQGSSLIVLIPDGNNSRVGRLLKKAGHYQKASSCGNYILGKDEALTLIVETEGIYAQERLWFASNNLRLRTTFVKDTNGSTQTSFYSEIRKALPKNQPSTTEAMAKSQP
ncbi:phycobiliprotein lyase [Pleurocapsales cyanobacterium LEGE 06147]|nr:phycobiliprotein lyase [Pleurocapsales cyanobacterium LEGE 06147]